MSAREMRVAGRDRLLLATRLLQRARRADPDAGIWELDDQAWTHSRLTCVAGLRAAAQARSSPRLTAAWSGLADTILADTARHAVHRSGRLDLLGVAGYEGTISPVRDAGAEAAGGEVPGPVRGTCTAGRRRGPGLLDGAAVRRRERGPAHGAEAALEGQRGQRHPPAAAHLAHHVGGRHPGVGQEHLVE